MPVTVTQDVFDQTQDGKDVARFTLSNSSGSLTVKIIEFGSTITEVKVPDRNGKVEDIALGFDDVAGYYQGTDYIGGIMGRTANRIAGGQFTLDGQTFNLFHNDGPNTNHGGQFGFNKKLWKGRVDGDKVVMQYVSPDGEEGYPGDLTVTLTFWVTDDAELHIQHEATTTKPTALNLTSHPNFNFAGHAYGSLDDHVVTLASEAYVPVDDANVPTGEIRKVEGTLFDVRKPTKIGERLPNVPGGKGFDHTFCLTPSGDGQPAFAAKMEHPPTGRFMEMWTTEPGMQFYSGFFLNIDKGKEGKPYRQFCGFALEAQHYPNSVNTPSFPNTVLRPGETYRQYTIYKFGIA